jgi:hypothetical chaperone protein
LADSFTPEIYAIDFGTSNSLVGAAARGAEHPPIDVDPHAADPTLLRSVLFYPEQPLAGDPDCFIGARAIEHYVRHRGRGRLLRSMKRFLPQRSFVRTRIGSRNYALEELIAAVLREMKTRADACFQTRVERVLLGRPARFSDDPAEDRLAEDRLRRAAELAGFSGVAFCPEPVAAARDIGVPLGEARLVLVADFGGGTSDFSVVRLGPGGAGLEQVLAVGGVSVAGDALDGSLMRGHVVQWFGADVTYRVPFGRNVLRMPRQLMERLCSPAELSLLSRRDVQSFLRDVRSWSLGERDREHVDRLLTLVDDMLGFQLFEAIEHTKKSLSTQPAAAFEFRAAGIDIEEHVERADFERAVEPDVSRIVAALDATLERAAISSGEVEAVFLTGGTSRVPRVHAALAERFGADKLSGLRGLHSVATGLTRHARWLLERE